MGQEGRARCVPDRGVNLGVLTFTPEATHFVSGLRLLSNRSQAVRGN